MTCPKCGTNNIDGSSSCIKCGANLIQIQPQQNVLNNVAPIQQEQQINNQPQINYQQSINNSYNGFNDNGIIDSKKKKSKLALIIILIIIVVLAIGIFFFFKKDKVSNKDFDINYSTSFFMSNNNSKYALFSDDGKKLSDYVFTSVSDFVNGTAIVKKDDSYGIINEKGKMNVDFGKYSYIDSAGGMYKVEGEDYHYFLINGEGKILYDLENMEIDSYEGEQYYSILEDKNSKMYKVLNSVGKEIVSIPIDSNAKDNPSTDVENGYISVFYNNKNYILDLITGKEITSFSSDSNLCIAYAIEDENIIILHTCTEWYKETDETYQIIIKDGKTYDFTDKCEEISYSDGSIVCTNDYKDYLIDSSMNVGIRIGGKAYVDNATYAMPKDGSFNGIDFYNNGNVVKNVACRDLKETGYMKNGLYILGTYYSKTCGTDYGTYEYYKLNGENAFGKSFKVANAFDENGLAKVSEEKEKYYLIDTNGKKISQEYSAISPYLDYYIVTQNDLKGVIDKNGNVIVDCLYSDIYMSERTNRKNAILITSDSKYIVYDISKRSEIITLDSSPSLNDHYISVSKDGKTLYYTYNGKMFYEK